MSDLPGQAARAAGEPVGSPEPTGLPQSQDVPPAEETEPAMEDTIPAPEDLTESSSVELGRIAWSVTTLALLIAMVVLALRGDIGYAGVTLAVAIAAAINLL